MNIKDLENYLNNCEFKTREYIEECAAEFLMENVGVNFFDVLSDGEFKKIFELIDKMSRGKDE